MKKSFVIVVALFIVSQNAVEIFAQNNLLKGNHSIYFESGFKTNSKTTVTTNFGSVETKTGFIGSLNYGYWFDEEWSLNFSAGVFGAEANTVAGNTEVSAIIPILLGVKYYPSILSIGTVGRVYLGISAGQYSGFATRKTGLSATQNISESALGGQLSIGFDWFIASWFKIGPNLSYHIMEDFAEVLGSKKNMSGGGFSFDFGFVF